MQEKNPMGYQPVFPLLLKMAFPPMISMLIGSLYNIIDSIFVAKLGEDALTAISLIYPLQNLSLAFSVGIGVALNALISRNIGANQRKDAEKVASQGLVMSFLCSLFFVFIGLFLIQPFLKLFTTNSQVIEYGIQYGFIVITFAFGQFIHIAIEKIFQACGSMFIPMMMQIFGAVVNIILDPILIFGYFGLPALGVKGAALATIIGQMSACLLSIYLMKFKNKLLKVQFKDFKIDGSIFKTLFNIALPSSLMMCLPSILVSVLNSLLAGISQTAVAFFGIFFKLQSFIYMPSNGVIQGLRPLMGYNYGARNKERMHQIIQSAGLSIFLILLFGTTLFWLFPKPILQMFSASDEMLSIGVNGLKILSLSFVLSSMSLVMCGVFESLGQGQLSLLISILRQFVITIPLAYLLVPFLSEMGVWFAFLIAEFIASDVSFYLYFKKYKKMVQFE